MANQPQGDFARTSDRLFNSSEIHSSIRARSSRASRYQFDDVIAILANMPENRRARQVSEWERLQRQSIKRSA